MLNLPLTNARRLLCLGAHSDDIEIGCGGTLLHLTGQSPGLEILWVVFSAEGSRRKEARDSAGAFLKSASKSSVRIARFRGSFFPYQGIRIKEFFETLKSFQPDVVFTHYRDDRHQDHRVLSDLAWNTFRNHLLLEYEIPKYDGDLGSPNVFFPLGETLVDTKIRHLCRFFRTQSNKHWFSGETFRGLMRLRGMECASTSGFAEAFYCRKLVLAP